MSTNLKTFNKTDKRILVAKLEKLKVFKVVILEGIERNQRRMYSSTFIRVRNAVLQDLKAIDKVLQLAENV